MTNFIQLFIHDLQTTISNEDEQIDSWTSMIILKDF